MKRKNYLLTCCVTMAFIIVAAGSALAGIPTRVVVNGKTISTEVTPLVINGTVMVPAKSLAAALGASYALDDAGGAVIITSRSSAAAVAPIKTAAVSAKAAGPTTSSAGKSFTRAGTYGPTKGREIVSGNVTIGSRGVVLQNTTVNRDLIVSGAAGSGDVTLNNVAVKGRLIVTGVSPGKVNLVNCSIAAIGVSDPKNAVEIVTAGNTSVGAVSMQSGGSLREAGSGAGFTNVSTDTINAAMIKLNGKFDTVTAGGTQPTIATTPNTAIARLDVNAAALVTGSGKIQNAFVKASNTAIESTPGTAVISTGASALVGGNQVDAATADALIINGQVVSGTVTSSSMMGSSGSAVSSSTKTLTWKGLSLTEASSNDGTVDGTITATLTGDTFANETFTIGNHYTVTNLPAGLTAKVTRTSDTTAAIVLNGKATEHSALKNISNLGITFQDLAFTSRNAAAISGYQSPSISITYLNPPANRSLTWENKSFWMEGVTTMSSQITLYQDTFTNTTFVKDTHYSVSNAPIGLIVTVTRVSDNTAKVTLTMDGTNHGTFNSLGITFKDAAFSGGNAATVSDYTSPNFAGIF